MSRIGFRPKRLGIRDCTISLAVGFREIGHPALIDLVGVGDDPALRRLPEHFGQPDCGDGSRADDVGEDLPGADGWQLVDVPDNQERRVIGDGS